MLNNKFFLTFLFTGLFSFLGNIAKANEIQALAFKSSYSNYYSYQPEKKHSPHRASVLSTVLPGAGQAYNRKYWKMPIIYGAMGGLTFSIISNRNQFKSYTQELSARANQDTISLNPKYANYPDSYVRSSRDSHRNNRDLSIVGLVAIYALNIVDAAVDAHLYKFDVDRSLSFKAKPIQTVQQGRISNGVSFGLSLRF